MKNKNKIAILFLAILLILPSFAFAKDVDEIVILGSDL